VIHRSWPVLLVVLAGCVGGPLKPGEQNYTLADAELRVAYVGNSLTYTYNIPGLVQALAEVDGRSMSHVSITAPNVNLEDHWYMGTPSVLRDLEPDVVVMQQGPSSLRENQINLAYWAGQFDGVIREFGGMPALYMVWPAVQYQQSFGDVWYSYRMAADRTGGLFIPAGRTWVEAWLIDPDLPLYGADGFHPSALGALAAARTIYAVLYDLPADSVPTLDVGADSAAMAALQAGLAASLAEARSEEALR